MTMLVSNPTRGIPLNYRTQFYIDYLLEDSLEFVTRANLTEKQFKCLTLYYGLKGEEPKTSDQIFDLIFNTQTDYIVSATRNYAEEKIHKKLYEKLSNNKDIDYIKTRYRNEIFFYNHLDLVFQFNESDDPIVKEDTDKMLRKLYKAHLTEYYRTLGNH